MMTEDANKMKFPITGHVVKNGELDEANETIDAGDFLIVVPAFEQGEGELVAAGAKAAAAGPHLHLIKPNGEQVTIYVTPEEMRRFMAAALGLGKFPKPEAPTRESLAAAANTTTSEGFITLHGTLGIGNHGVLINASEVSAVILSPTGRYVQDQAGRIIPISHAAFLMKNGEWLQGIADRPFLVGDTADFFTSPLLEIPRQAGFLERLPAGIAMLLNRDTKIAEAGLMAAKRAGRLHPFEITPLSSIPAKNVHALIVTRSGGHLTLSHQDRDVLTEIPLPREQAILFMRQVAQETTDRKIKRAVRLQIVCSKQGFIILPRGQKIDPAIKRALGLGWWENRKPLTPQNIPA